VVQKDGEFRSERMRRFQARLCGLAFVDMTRAAIRFGLDAVRELERLASERGRPLMIVSDNGS
jgi:hypothetical protein